MEYRTLGRTGWQVSASSFGAWAIGADWGTVDDQESLAALHRAIDLGVNFIDTADVYGDGRSERLVSQLLKERSETIYVATKAGRRLNPHVASAYIGAAYIYYNIRKDVGMARAFLESGMRFCRDDPQVGEIQKFLEIVKKNR